MKKILLTIAIAMSIQVTYACDICGAGVSNNNNSLLFPHLHKRYVGITYLYRSYKITGDDGLTSVERYNTLLLTAQFTITKSLQLSATLPFQVNKKEDYFTSESLHGLGDATLTLNYKLLDKNKDNKKHVLFFGVGVKLPAGKYVALKTTELDEQNFQLGTGSVDYILSSSYTFKKKNWALGATASYKYNTKNKRGFRFGDMVTTSAAAAYKITAKRFAISPYIQLRDEAQMFNADNHVLQTHTGGNALYSMFGTDISIKKISFGMAYQLAPIQHLAAGQIKADPSFSTRISLTF